MRVSFNNRHGVLSLFVSGRFDLIQTVRLGGAYNSIPLPVLHNTANTTEYPASSVFAIDMRVNPSFGAYNT